MLLLLQNISSSSERITKKCIIDYDIVTLQKRLICSSKSRLKQLYYQNIVFSIIKISHYCNSIYQILSSCACTKTAALSELAYATVLRKFIKLNACLLVALAVSKSYLEITNSRSPLPSLLAQSIG